MLLSVTMLRRALTAVLLTLSAASSTVASDLARRNSTGLTDAVTWDPHSLSIFGQRVFILSAEVHPWRQPNPDLWADVFEKIKANGFNTVSFYVHWALHYPTPDTNGGKGDWQEGTYRDLQRFIDEAKNAGLWMIARCDSVACIALNLLPSTACCLVDQVPISVSFCTVIEGQPLCLMYPSRCRNHRGRLSRLGGQYCRISAY